MSEVLAELINVSKAFNEVTVLDGVDFKLRKGTVHALLGENGAGKSTMMKILSGFLTPSGGKINVKGDKHRFNGVQDAQALGIAMIHQELMYVPDMSIAENMFLGHEPKLGALGIVDKTKLFTDTEAALSRLGIGFSPHELMRNLNVSQRQLVEISKAISQNADILIMDEPTSALEDREVVNLFRIVKELKMKGVGIIYISHKMKEIFEIADDYTVLRDGRSIVSGMISETNQQSIIASMVGRELSNVFNGDRELPNGDTLLEVRSLSRKGVFSDISFCLKKGEILGFGGLMGAGRTEVVRCLYGLDEITAGEIRIDDMPISVGSPSDALKSGIALVSDDRKNIGLVLGLSIKENLSLQNQYLFSKYFVINKEREDDVSRTVVKDMLIRAQSISQKVSTLSGGNQQKVVIGKVLLSKPKILILDEPTRGIDIGAKAEIYRLIRNLASEGVSIILVSSELPELIGLSDRIAVFRTGRIAGFVSKEDATEQRIMEHAFN